MAESMNIQDLDKLNKSSVDPLYVMVAGGMGAGKSFIIEKNLHSYGLIDVDKIMVKMGLTNYSHDNFMEAMKAASELIEMHMDMGSSVIAMGTSSNLPLAINRLLNAKYRFYNTILIHIDAPVHQAMEQNRQRISDGERGVSKSEEGKIALTTDAARETVKVLKETELVDYFVYYDNTRPVVQEINYG